MKKIFLLFCSLVTLSYAQTNNWDGNYYLDHSQMQYDTAINTLNMISISPNAKILDIGCGDGRITQYVANITNQGSAIGIDKSASMIDKAQHRTSSNLSFLVKDVEKMDFSKQFDYVISFNCLHWISDIDLALSNIYQSLLPRGEALLLVAPIQPSHLFHDIINKVAHNDDWRHYFDDTASIFTLYTSFEWSSLIQRAKMVIKTLQWVPIRFDYPNKEEFANWLSGWIPFGSIPNEKRSLFVEKIVEEYVKNIPEKSDGTVQLLMDELLILCTKAD